MEERPVESSTIARPGPAPRTRRADADPLETDIVQILAKIKGKVNDHRVAIFLNRKNTVNFSVFEKRKTLI